MAAPSYDPRCSERHRHLLGTPRTLAYLPHALRWALRAEVVTTALALGGMLGLFALSWLGLLFAALFGTAALSWLLALQARAIDGYGDPPRLTLEHLNLFRGAPRAVAELIGAAFMAYGLLYLVWPTGAPWFAYALGALLPTVFALAAVEDALWPALRPRAVWRGALAGGWVGGLLAVAFAWLTEAVFEAVAGFIRVLDAAGLAAVMVGWAPSLQSVAVGAGGVWTLALLAHLHGHALHHRRATAGLSASLAAPDATESERTRRAAAVERVAAALERASEAKDRSAAAQLAALPPPDGVDELAYRSDLWEALLFRRRYAAAVKVAAPLVRVAAERKRAAFALEVLTEARRLSPSFEPGPAARVALARASLASGDDDGFERISALDAAAWPQDPAVVELAYLRAGWLAERRGDPAAAAALLSTVLAREHPLAERIRRLHAMLVGLPGLEPGTKRL